MKNSTRVFIYKWALVGVALLLLVFPSVADKMPQIDSRIMITAIGLDAGEGEELEMTAAVTVPSGSGSGGKESTATAKGDSIGSLIDDLSRSLGKRAELAHCAMLALGKELCEKGVKTIIEDLINSGGLSDGVSVVAADGKAGKLIESAANLSESAAFSLGGFLSFAGEDAQIPMVSIVCFASDNNSAGGGSFLPILKMSEPKSDGGESSGESSGAGGGSGESSDGGGESGGGGGSESKAQIVSADTTLIFKNYKAVGEFDEEATFALTWLDSQSDRGIVKLDNFELGGKNLGNFAFNIRKKGVEAKASFDKDPTVTVVIDAQLELHASNRLAEIKESGMPVMKINEAIRNALVEQLDKQIKTGWDKAKEAKADPFKYDYRLYKKDPARYEREFSNGDVIFDRLKLETKIDILLI